MTTKELNEQLLPLVLEGNKTACEQMAKANMPFVHWKAKGFLSAHPEYQHLKDDLIAEGYLGIVKAIDRLRTGTQVNCLETYLAVAIKDAFRDCIVHEALIQIPQRTQRRRDQHNLPLPNLTSHSLEDIHEDRQLTDLESFIETSDEIKACCETEEDKAIIDLRVQQFKDTEIARHLGITINQVWQRRRTIYMNYMRRTK